MSDTLAVEDFKREMRAELAAVRADNERLRTEVKELRSATRGTPRTRAAADDEGGGAHTAPMSRGQFLRMGAAMAAAGAGGALVGAGPAGAAVGTMQYGATNDAGADFTRLDSAHTGATLILRNAAASNGGGLNAGGSLYGAYAEGNRHGVVGVRKGTSVDPFLEIGSGVIGVSSEGTNGVAGVCTGSSLSWGVLGRTDAGYGVVADSTSGISVWAAGGGRIRQALRGAGAPTAGSFLAGEQIRDANGELWLCVVGGSPGTWRRAATVKEGFDGGSVNLLTRPIRIYDSRSTGGILAAGATRNVPVTGVVAGGLSVPAGAKGVLGNITVVNTGVGGYLTLFPQGSPPAAANVTASVNWFAANQVLNNAALVRLNPANGQIGVGNGLGGASTSTHFVFDATGFVF